MSGHIEFDQVQQQSQQVTQSMRDSNVALALPVNPFYLKKKNRSKTNNQA